MLNATWWCVAHDNPACILAEEHTHCEDIVFGGCLMVMPYYDKVGEELTHFAQALMEEL